MIDLPFHIKRLRIVTLEQAALAMAGLSGECDDIETAIAGKYTGYEKAVTFKEIIIQAIKLHELIPLQAYQTPNPMYDLPPAVHLRIDNENITLESPLVDATFLAKDIWPWVINELSGSNPLYTPDILENKNLNIEDISLTQKSIDSPIKGITASSKSLSVNRRSHQSEGLELLEAAIAQLWSTYDEDEPRTAPTKGQVLDFLSSLGATGNMAKAIDLILRPNTLRYAGRPKSR
ncbi:hypothetical protein [Salmonella enterica]|uniref:hypothetical protein n=1 Tax=Salmonella enterica TaxID=28901 RepID=UPI003314759A